MLLFILLLLLGCDEDRNDLLALKTMKNRVRMEIDSLELLMKEKARLEIDSLDSIMKENALADICDSSCETRKKKFERSIIEIIFRTNGTQGSTLEVFKTTTGAWSIHSCPGYCGGKLALSMEEWQDLVKVLYKYCINNSKWENYRGDNSISGAVWTLKILSSNKNRGTDTLEFKSLRKQPPPPHWAEVIKVIDDIKGKIRKETKVKKVESK